MRPRSLGLSFVQTGSSSPFSTKSLTGGSDKAASLGNILQSDREALGAEGAIDGDQAVRPHHLAPLVLRKAGDDRPDIFRIAPAAAPQGDRRQRADLRLLVEQAPDEVVERQARIRQLFRLHRSGKDGDVRPVGVVELRMDSLPALLAFRQMLEQQAAGGPAPVPLLGREPDETRDLLGLAEIALRRMRKAVAL